jgi:hydroxymethylbilane synthase
VTTPAQTLRLGARGSLLSRMQSQWVADALEKAHPDLRVELVLIKTTGDQITDRPLHDAGGKGLFTKEIELALLKNEIDFAVHSYKDVPVTMPLVDQSDLIMAATPPREDPRDVLISPHAKSIHDLPPGAKVGTGSLRRRCQLLAARPDLRVELIRGNVDTRIRKLREGQYDAILLAYAGLRRSAQFDGQDMTPLFPDDLLPAAGQGALALQCRRDDPRTNGLLSVLHDANTATCVNLERALVQSLNGDCNSPIAALATLDANNHLTLRAAVGKAGGTPPVLHATAAGAATDPSSLLHTVVTDLERQGVRDLLKIP